MRSVRRFREGKQAFKSKRSFTFTLQVGIAKLKPLEPINCSVNSCSEHERRTQWECEVRAWMDRVYQLNLWWFHQRHWCSPSPINARSTVESIAPVNVIASPSATRNTTRNAAIHIAQPPVPPNSTMYREGLKRKVQFQLPPPT